MIKILPNEGLSRSAIEYSDFFLELLFKETWRFGIDRGLLLEPQR